MSMCPSSTYPKESYLTIEKQIFRHLKGTIDHGLWYPKNSDFDLKGYSNSDFHRCHTYTKSTIYTSLLGPCTGSFLSSKI